MTEHFAHLGQPDPVPRGYTFKLPPKSKLPKCGCGFVIGEWGDESTWHLKFCPLHEAAPKLLEALTAANDTMQGIHAVLPSSALGDWYWDDLQKSIQKAKTALKRATRQPDAQV